MTDAEHGTQTGGEPKLMPFFTYFGGKYRAAPRYPSPRYDAVVEPFCGSAGYSVRHAAKSVLLYDADEAVIGTWQYLIGVSSAEIAALPLTFDHVDDLRVPQEAKWLIGYWLNKGATTPRLTPSAWMRSGTRPNSYWGVAIRERLASQVDHIRHWKAVRCDYTAVPLIEGTWFVDPPYNHLSGRLYRYGVSDFEKLARWCKALRGQVMVCERADADWLPFAPFATTKATPGSRGKGHSQEVAWFRDTPHTGREQES